VPPAAEKAKRASGSGRQKASLHRQAKLEPGTATGQRHHRKVIFVYGQVWPFCMFFPVRPAESRVSKSICKLFVNDMNAKKTKSSAGQEICYNNKD